MKAMADLKQGLSEGWRSLAEGWEHMRSAHRGSLAADVFEDGGKIVVRMEAPGMDARDFDVQVYGNILVLRGEKRSVQEAGEGTWRMLERAYGTFERTFRLPADVRAEEAAASYRRGVLRIELPKAKPDAPRHVRVTVQ